MTERFYSELARWWPLISPVEEYAGEAEEFLRVLRAAAPDAQTLLELGSGGGHNAYYMKAHFQLTLSDLSEQMLDVSKRLNPECEHTAGDMRSLQLQRTFDAVFVHDAIHYMLTEADLAAAIATAFRHCKPGGVALIVPDALTETFEPDSDCGGSDAPDGSGVRYLEWDLAPSAGTQIGQTYYTFLTREANGVVESFTEAHPFGLFARDTFVRLIEHQGFHVQLLTEHTDEDRTARTMFLCTRPLA
jgi:ubiquinone/menaquinone biosynthesis C-methylase UbiE